MPQLLCGLALPPLISLLWSSSSSLYMIYMVSGAVHLSVRLFNYCRICYFLTNTQHLPPDKKAVETDRCLGMHGSDGSRRFLRRS